LRGSARILTATNVRLEQRMERGEFLRGLYDRLAFDIVEVPPLREREGDIRVLARHFLERFMAEIPALGGKRLAPAAMAALERYPFPGNVRELKGPTRLARLDGEPWKGRTMAGIARADTALHSRHSAPGGAPQKLQRWPR
jgi:DNA-binding NtrC family response regulator